MAENHSMREKLDVYAVGVFRELTSRPRTVVAAGLFLVLACGTFLPTMVVDTSVEGFVPGDSPALARREQMREMFGLSDPMVIALVASGPNGIFTPQTLALISQVTERVREIPGIDPDQVTSLATEKSIAGNSEGLVVEDFLDPLPASQADAQRVRESVMSIPLFEGTLVARDGSATLIAAELLDRNAGEPVYQELLRIAQEEQTAEVKLYVAGQGAVDGFLHVYVQRDAGG